MAGALGILAGASVPAAAQAPGFLLKPGCNYAIGFQENMAPGVPPAGAPAPAGHNVATYRVMGTAGDQQWYRLRMVARAPQGGWYTPPGTPEVWVNLTYAMWVQEVLR